MGDNAAYDITGEIDPVDKVDEVQAKLAKRRQDREQETETRPVAESELATGGSESPKDPEGQKQADAKKRAAETAKKKREEDERRRELRRQELRESRWVTAGHKVREKRVEFLERVFFRLKADGEFRGTKQEFFDEGLAMLEEKYTSTAKPEG